MATSLREGKLWIQTSCWSGDRWVLPNYSCQRPTTWITPPQLNQVMKPLKNMKFICKYNNYSSRLCLVRFLCGLFNAKAILLEEQQWCYSTHSWEDKGAHTFSKGIRLKVNVIAWMEFELTTILQSSALTITSWGHPLF